MRCTVAILRHLLIYGLFFSLSISFFTYYTLLTASQSRRSMTKPAFVSLDTDPQVLDRAALAAGGRLSQVLDKKHSVNKEDSASDQIQAMSDERGEHGIIRTLNNNKKYEHIMEPLMELDGHVVDIVPSEEKQKLSQDFNDIEWDNTIVNDKQVATGMSEAPVTVDKQIDDPYIESLHVDSNRKHFVIMAIHSGLRQITRRTAIRNTWLSMTHNASLIYWFVIGARSADETTMRDLREEQDRYNDLLIFWDIDNDYSQLTTRSLHTMLHIANNYHFTYYLKTDDDMFLNLPLVLRELETHSCTRLYWGRFSCHNPPMESGRWRETLWNSCDVYFPYAYGGLYVLSSDLVTLLADQAPHLKLYTCEDVSLGAWLAPYNIERVNNARIYIQHNNQCGRGYIAVHINHPLAHKQIRKFYNNLRTTGAICSKPVHEEVLLWRDMPLHCTTIDTVIV